MAAGLENVVEANHVGLDIGIGILDRIADTGLSSKIHHDIEMILGEEGIDGGFVSDVTLDEDKRPPLIPLLRGKVRSPP